jgi:hypothetical protein
LNNRSCNSGYFSKKIEFFPFFLQILPENNSPIPRGIGLVFFALILSVAQMGVILCKLSEEHLRRAEENVSGAKARMFLCLFRHG